MIPVVKKPADCTGEELREFTKLVIQGGQVSRSGLEQRIRRARLLAFAYEDGKLAGVAAVKRASWLYVRDVFRKANTAEAAIDQWYEIGWGYTLPEYRNSGIHKCLIDLLLDNVRDVNVFGTTGTNNKAVIAIVIKRGFEKCGSPYPGRTEAKQIWVKKAATERRLGKWLLKNLDLALRGAERFESYKYLLASFRRMIKHG